MRYLTCFLFFFCSLLHAQNEPVFTDYIVKEIYNGPVAPLHLSDSQKNYVYGEYLNAAETANSVNYSGHYILFIYGCGGGALCTGVKDAKSGLLLDTGTDAYNSAFWHGATFKKDSCLLKISGKTFDEKDIGIDFFVLKNNELIKISTQEID